MLTNSVDDWLEALDLLEASINGIPIAWAVVDNPSDKAKYLVVPTEGGNGEDERQQFPKIFCHSGCGLCTLDT